MAVSSPSHRTTRQAGHKGFQHFGNAPAAPNPTGQPIRRRIAIREQTVFTGSSMFGASARTRGAAQNSTHLLLSKSEGRSGVRCHVYRSDQAELLGYAEVEGAAMGQTLNLRIRRHPSGIRLTGLSAIFSMFSHVFRGFSACLTITAGIQLPHAYPLDPRQA